ncbi:MAG: hypothetical protein O2973_04550 [Gemmatimonadetes bacterium]|nr:hypothetical protein [Gemmatimonadota bacterium]
MPLTDPSLFIGSYPFRHVPHPDPDVLVRVMDREGIDHAWVGHLPSAFHRDPAAGNAELHKALEPYRARLAPAPAVRPDFPGWERALDEAVAGGAAAIRVYPPQWRLAPGDAGLGDLAIASGEHKLPLVLTVRFEDLRQRHPLDTAGDVTAAAVRSLARADEMVRLVVCAAGKDFIEEVHWGLTPDEQSRVLWDISWIWGPPEDHLAKLFRTIGPSRFVFGSQWPLRLVQAPRANLELLPDDFVGATLGDPAALYR